MHFQAGVTVTESLGSDGKLTSTLTASATKSTNGTFTLVSTNANGQATSTFTVSVTEDALSSQMLSSQALEAASEAFQNTNVVVGTSLFAACIVAVAVGVVGYKVYERRALRRAYRGLGTENKDNYGSSSFRA